MAGFRARSRARMDSGAPPTEGERTCGRRAVLPCLDQGARRLDGVAGISSPGSPSQGIHVPSPSSSTPSSPPLRPKVLFRHVQGPAPDPNETPNHRGRPIPPVCGLLDRLLRTNSPSSHDDIPFKKRGSPPGAAFFSAAPFFFPENSPRTTSNFLPVMLFDDFGTSRLEKHPTNPRVGGVS